MSNTSSAVRSRRRSRGRVTMGVLTVGGAAVLAATALSLAGSASVVPTTLKVTQNTSWGPTLALKNGDTVYAFAKDTKNKSNCTGQCAVDWPPVLLSAGQKAPDGIGVKDLGAIMRTNGTHQVTYEGIPLYRFVGDKAPGQVNGNITAFGGLWRSVSPKSPHTPPTEKSGSSSGSGSTGSTGSTGATGPSGGSGGTTTTTQPPTSGISY
jgi:predicted lipoprotein with Yx(FWY)xxD motif